MEILDKPPGKTTTEQYSDNCGSNVTLLVNKDDITGPLTNVMWFFHLAVMDLQASNRAALVHSCIHSSKALSESPLSN